MGRADGVELVAEVVCLVRRAITDVGARLLGFLADAQSLGATQLAHLQGHAVDKVSIFGGRKVFEQALPELFDVRGELTSPPVKHGTVDYPGQRARQLPEQVAFRIQA